LRDKHLCSDSSLGTDPPSSIYGRIKSVHWETEMNMQLRTDETSKASHLIANFAKAVNAEGEHVAETEQYGLMARCHFDEAAFVLSIFMMLFLIASVLAIALYTVR
jgi:hypothetical protein